MNAWQAAKQLQFLLQTAVWPDAPGGPVFASVHATQAPGDSAAEILRFPLALIKLGDSTSDPQTPGLETQKFEITVVVANAGDQLGEFALVGGQRASQGKSQGRGLLEVQQAVRDALNVVNLTNDFEIQGVFAATAEAVEVEGRGYVIARTYTLDCLLTSDRTYPPPNATNALTAAKGTPSGGLTPVTVSWATPVQRFDFHPAYTTPALAARGALVLVRKQGTVAPANSSDGTVVAVTGGAFGTSASDSLTNGQTWTYGLFAQFDEYGDGVTSVRTSSPSTVTVSV